MVVEIKVGSFYKTFKLTVPKDKSIYNTLQNPTLLFICDQRLVLVYEVEHYRESTHSTDFSIALFLKNISSLIEW